MKVKNLLKKVGSVMTTAALLATLGTTAFADNVISSSGKEGGAITAPEVHAEEVTPGSGIYNLVVKCNTTAANKTGMTMLIYKIADNTDADINNPGYYDGETTSGKKKMQIVGIDQIAKVDGSADTNGKEVVFGKELNSEDTTKTSIRISTNKPANGSSDNYYVPVGKKVLIAVSGDQCTPAYALLEFTGTAASASYGLGTVKIDANKNISEALNDWMESNKNNVEADFADASEVIIGRAKLDKVNFNGVNWTKSKTEENVYTATVTLSNDDVSGVKIDEPIPLYLTATVQIQAVPGTVTKLAGQTVTTSGSELSAELTVSKKDLDENPGIQALTSLLNTKFKTATISDGGNPALEDRINATFALENPGTTYDGNEYWYIATVGGDDEASLKGEDGNVKLNAKATIKVKVTLSEDSITVNGIVDKDNNSITAIDSVQVPSDTTEANVASAVKEKLSDYSLSYTENKDGSTEQKTIALTDNKVKYTSAVKDGKVTFTINTIDGIALVSPFSVVVPYTIAPAGVPVYLGDVNMDGEVNGQDWQLIMFHNNNLNPIPALKDKTSVQYKAANINNDDEINGQDWQLIMFHNNNLNPNPDIGKKIVGYKSVE